MSESEKFQIATRKIDAVNEEDPNRETLDDREWPKELAYSKRMIRWLERLEPDASEAVQLAVRAQHIGRWKIPRSDYSKGRLGYLDWRNACKAMHAEVAGEILREAGYSEEAAAHVSDIIQKKKLKLDPDAQLLEDVACLVFLESYFADFSSKYDPEKIIGIVRKTWKKMSTRGHEAAQTITMTDALRVLVGKALSDS